MEKFFSGLKRLLFSLPGQGLMSSLLLLSSFFAMFSAIPALYTYTLAGRRNGVIVLSFGLLFTMLFAGTSGFVFYLAMIFFTTIVLGEFVNSKLDFAKTLAIGSAIIVVTLTLVVLLYAAASPVSLKDLIIANVSNAIGSMELVYPDVFNNLIKESGMTKIEIITSIAVILPSYVFIGVVIFMFFNLVLISRFHEHLRSFLSVENLKTFKIPEQFIWVGLACSALFLYSNSSYNSSFYINLLGAFLFKGVMVFYFLQGLCISFVFLQKNIQAAFFRNLLLSLMVVFAYVFITAVGFFDTWFDFRKFLKKGEEQ